MNIFKRIYNRILGLLGYPKAPRPEQIGERLVTMRCDGGRDCAVPVVANALGITYEKAHNALHHADLPGPLESPLMSNPLWLCRAIESLGYEANDSITLTEFLNGPMPTGKVIVLMHDPKNFYRGLLNQHWVTYEGRVGDSYLFHWGLTQDLVARSKEQVIKLITCGFPNCIIRVE